MEKKVLIIGGGITGLSTAHFLQKKGIDPVVLEAREEAGGNIRSSSREGYTLESGPNTVMLNNDSLRQLIKDLNKDIIYPLDTAGNRFILKKGKLHALPSGPGSFLSSSLLSFSGKIRALKEPFIAPNKDDFDESIADFSKRRFGKELYKNFIVPFVTGVYAGNPEEMSTRYALKMLHDAEQDHGSVIKGMMKKAGENKKAGKAKSKIFSFKGGLQTMTEQLRENMGEQFISGATAFSFHRKGESYKVEYYHNGEKKSIETDKVIFTIPAYTLAKLIGSHSMELTNLLNMVKYVPVSSIHLGYEKSKVGDQKHQGFGVLTPEYENSSFLGALFSSRIFPHTAPEGKELFTLMVGGARSPELTKLPEEELLEKVRKEFENLMEIKSDPDFVNIHKWEKAIPQYDMYHHYLINTVRQFEKEFPGVYIAGNYVRGISVPDCVEKSHNLAEQISN